MVFFGGEPLLERKLVADLVARARDVARAGRFHFKMTTNGLDLDEGFLRFAMENDVLDRCQLAELAPSMLPSDPWRI